MICMPLNVLYWFDKIPSCYFLRYFWTFCWQGIGNSHWVSPVLSRHGRPADLAHCTAVCLLPGQLASVEWFVLESADCSALTHREAEAPKFFVTYGRKPRFMAGLGATFPAEHRIQQGWQGEPWASLKARPTC